MTREKTGRALLWFAVIWWGIWFGGQLFNGMMVVPYFSANPPASLQEWGRMRHHNDGDFFVIFNSIWIFIATLIAIVLVRGAARRWAVASASLALISFLFLLWMVPTISRLVTPGQGGQSAAEAAHHLRMWTHANFARLLVELIGFICGLKAIIAPAAPPASATPSR
jgi:hypothetical protein